MTPIASKLADIYGKKKMLLIILAVYIFISLGSYREPFMVTPREIQGIRFGILDGQCQKSKSKFCDTKPGSFLYPDVLMMLEDIK
jgi:MFS family permease